MPRVHFVGIGGAGMSALAHVLIEMGYEVSGSDLVSSEATRRLASQGATIFQGHRAEQVGNPDLVVVSAAVPAGNPEVEEARARGLPILGRSELLARLMAERDGVGVAGAHGKTTTASMVAVCLERAGFDPTVLIGGELNDAAATSRLGRGRYLVAEVDEYDGTILLLEAYVALVTNIDDDHLERYRYSMDELMAAFRRFLEQVRPDGAAVACLDSPYVRRALNGYGRRLITYALNGEADYSAQDIQLQPGGSRFTAWFRGRRLGEVRLSVPGRHNVQNALGAIAACSFLGVEFPSAREALASFRGVRRRFETLGIERGIRVVDDFAHHPAEVEATLRAARQEAGEGRVVCLFQPHRYTRTQILHRAFGPALVLADLVGVMDIYPAAETPIPGVTGELVAQAVRDQGKEAPFLPSPGEALAWLQSTARPGDLVLVMGAGDVWKLGKEFLRHLRGGGSVGTGAGPSA
ncbi:MAG: UDP-N-acetylmuramate--L-alanine ligase [Bacillota bacterium]